LDLVLFSYFFRVMQKTGKLIVIDGTDGS